MHLKMDDRGMFDIPCKVFSPTQMTKHEKKVVDAKLRSELEQIQSLKKAPRLRTETTTSNNILSPSPEAHLRKPNFGKKNFSGSSNSVTMSQPTSISKTSALQMKQCQILLDRMLQHTDAWVFDEPVDPIKLKIPNYFDVIKHPMDLGTIRDKIDKNSYSSPWDFAADVRLTFSNAMKFNPPGNFVNSLALSFSEFFESRWKLIQRKLERERSAVQPKERKASSFSYCINQSVKQKQEVTQQEKRSLLNYILYLKDRPKSISELLEHHKVITRANGSIDLNLSCLNDDVFFKMKKILDASSTEKQPGQQANPETNESKIFNGTDLTNSSIHPCQGNELSDEQVDIVGDDTPTSRKETDRDVMFGREKRSSSSSDSSSSSSDSSSSDSSSDSSSESESSDDEVTSAKDTEERATNGEDPDQDKSGPDLYDQKLSSKSSGSNQRNIPTDLQSVTAVKSGEEENVPPERQSPLKKLPQVAMRRVYFEDIVLQACENTLDQNEKTNFENEQAVHSRKEENIPPETRSSLKRFPQPAMQRVRFDDEILKASENKLSQSEKPDSKKVQRMQELERLQKKEKDSLQAEANARIEAHAKAKAEAKSKLEHERQAGHQHYIQQSRVQLFGKLAE